MSDINNIKTIRFLGFFLLFSIFLQIILGAWVRLTGSGMSCPDWPLCYGFIFPTPEKIQGLNNIKYTFFQIFLEWIHRANAAFIIGPITVIFALIIFLKKNIEKIYKKYANFLLIILVLQSALGGLTVFKSNIPWSVAIHLMFAFLFYLIVLLTVMQTFNISNHIFMGTKFLKFNTILLAILTLTAACAGAFTSKYGASLSCDSWPGCSSKFLPNFNDAFQFIHFSHRIVVFALVLALVTFFIKVYNNFKDLSKQIKVILLVIFLVIVFQIAFGALLIFWKVPIWLGILHQACGLLLFTLVSILYLHIEIKNKNRNI